MRCQGALPAAIERRAGWGAGSANGQLASGNFAAYRISDARIMGYLRNNSIFTFGKVDRARTSATFRDILDAMWLFNDKFVRARTRFEEIKAQERGPAR